MLARFDRCGGRLDDLPADGAAGADCALPAPSGVRRKEVRQAYLVGLVRSIGVARCRLYRRAERSATRRNVIIGPRSLPIRTTCLVRQDRHAVDGRLASHRGRSNLTSQQA